MTSCQAKYCKHLLLTGRGLASQIYEVKTSFPNGGDASASQDFEDDASASQKYEVETSSPEIAPAVFVLSSL